MILLFLICAVFFILFCGIKTSKAVNTLIKIVPTASCALWALVFGNNPLITIGLFMCVIADAVLNYVFLPGAVLFALSHICFIVGFWVIHIPALWQLACFAVMVCVLAIIILNSGNSSKKPISLIYTVFLCAMASIAAGCGCVFAASGTLFALSDTILGIRILYKKRSPIGSWICMGTYYAALFLMAAGT